MILKCSVYKQIFDIGLLYTFFFSLACGLLFALLSTFFKPKANRIIATCLTVFLILLFGLQIVYHQIFQVFFVLYSIQTAAGALELGWEVALNSLVAKLPFILLILIPLLALLIFRKKIFRFEKVKWTIKGALAGGLILTQLLGTFLVYGSDSKRWYVSEFDPDQSIGLFGLTTTTRLDIQQLIFGVSGDLGGGSSELPTVDDPDIQWIPRSPQVISSLNFNTLAANETNATVKQMHEYFASQTPTYTNDYTGMFEGKNLIWIVAEAFSPGVLSLAPELTPNLNRLYNEGFQFTNFYTPIWGVSTSDGEYVTLQSLLPKRGTWSMRDSSKNYLPFTMAHQLGAEGYDTLLAYHNHTYTYYGRNQSHPNLGYEYQAIGNGLKLPHNIWPNSDLEMMEATVSNYIDKEPFHVYYLTVSGHTLYNWGGNNMCRRNRATVDAANLPYSEAIKAYLACNIELDKAIGYLLEQLEEAGIADDTVIALSADHYPYGLEDSGSSMDELFGHEVDSVFEKYKNSFLLWSGSMEEPIVVNKLGTSLDVLPTLSNLMGITYDSRLMMGTDLLSNSEPLVIFKSYSWISAYGRYDFDKKIFTPNPGVTGLPDNYVDIVNDVVSQKFTISRLILEQNYYQKILG